MAAKHETATKTKMPVTIRAVTQRLNRRLKSEYLVLTATRGDQQREQFGDYFLLNFRKKTVVRTHIDLELLARDWGVLQDWEKMK
jgi:hypothetical protein